MEIDNLPKREFRVVITNMIKELERRMDAQNEKLEVFNKELENTKNNQAEIKNIIIEMKKYSRRNQQTAKWHRRRRG